ncbi:MAG: NAD(P)(+) transhydrogenase (Re/Si-specific) subunit alpha [Myxococcales bacterium]|nr:NAD(P)(+) transhydrogenase (Re/Si-specific) subunit alpha [Myxococcales bacterium]
MKIGIPLETAEGERRVAATPDTVTKLKKMGFEVMISAGAGDRASYRDELYESAGAEITDHATVWSTADLVLKVAPPSLEEAKAMKSGSVFMGLLWPAENEALMEAFKEGGISAIAMDCVPRITRAQKLDARSSMSNIDGYRAVIEAAYHFGSFFSGQFTAAGKVNPAKILIVGAGVAGLAALGAARGLGAQVIAFDVRAAAREQVESMGAQFLEVEIEEAGEGDGGYAKEMSERFTEAQMALFKSLAPDLDVVITTALIPGRDAPKLWRSEALAEMKAGSVVVDLAAERGGNCDATVKGELITTDNGVKVIGYTDMTSRMAPTASQLYGMNFVHYLRDIKSGEGEIELDLTDVVVRSSIVTHNNELLYPPPPLSELDPSSVSKEMKSTPSEDKTVEAPAAAKIAATPAAPARSQTTSASSKETTNNVVGEYGWKQVLISVAVVLWIFLLMRATPEAASESTRVFLNHLTVFALSCFIGWQVIWNVSHALHTPLMSVTNAISGIILVGGMLQAHGTELNTASMFGGLAVLLAMINVVGGFAVTHRMLAMFRK